MSGVSALILAAGLSTRMGDANKLTTRWNGKALVAHVAEAALASCLDKVVVVTGHDAETVTALLPEGCLIAHNIDYAEGMAGSIRCGLYRLQGYGPVMVLLGDMPLVTASHIDALIAAFEGQGDAAIVAATCEGEIGNPVLFGVTHFRALKLLEGDRGARSVIGGNADQVIGVEIGAAARRDFDTPEAFQQTN